MKKIVLSLILLAFLAVPTSSYALLGFGIEASVGLSQSTASGDFGYKNAANFDLEDAFGFDDTNTQQMARVKAYLPLIIPNVYYVHHQMSFSGNATTTINFGGSTINPSNATKLEIVSNDYALFYEVPFVGLATAGIAKVEFGINVRELSITTEMENVVDETDFSVWIPQGYAAVSIDFPFIPVILQGEIRTLAIDKDNECTSYTARIIFELPIPLPLGDIFVAAGYRNDIYKIDADDVFADTEFETYFVEAGFKF